MVKDVAEREIAFLDLASSNAWKPKKNFERFGSTSGGHQREASQRKGKGLIDKGRPVVVAHIDHYIQLAFQSRFESELDFLATMTAGHGRRRANDDDDNDLSSLWPKVVVFDLEYVL